MERRKGGLLCACFFFFLLPTAMAALSAAGRCASAARPSGSRSSRTSTTARTRGRSGGGLRTPAPRASRLSPSTGSTQARPCPAFLFPIHPIHCPRRPPPPSSLAPLSSDLAIFLGDVLTANNLPSPNATVYWDEAVAPAEERGIPWAAVLGNHDDMAFEWPLQWFSSSGIPGMTDVHTYFRGTTRLQLARNDKKHALSLTSEGPVDLWPSVSNFAIPIASWNESSYVAILYFLDSGGGSYPELISASQVEWFHNISTELNPDSEIPELLFWHIPSLAYTEVAPPPNSEIRSPCVGSINLEAVAPQAAEFGMMDLLSRRKSVKGVFTGHNHGLDWCCPYSSLWLCFARHTGYGGYGTWIRGARIIDMVQREDDELELQTWITLENGEDTSLSKLAFT